MLFKSISQFLCAALICGHSSALAADIVAGNVIQVLGPDFIFNTATTGGDDNSATNLTRDLTDIFSAGASVSLKGVAWASPAGTATTATRVTAIFTDPGPDGVIGTTDDVVVGSVTDNLVFSGANTYVWAFDAPVTFISSNGNLRLQLNANGVVRRKTSSGTTAANVKLSLAGTATGGTPPPTNNTANGSGFWDTIPWDAGSGTITGGVNDTDSAQIGRHRTVTYRGIPATETVATLNLGEAAANPGQGTLVIHSGALSVTGNLNAGRNTSANDSFVFVNGGSLKVGGNAFFGRSALNCDGSLIVAGGAVEITGDLAMGAYEQGGSMLRFHNPGSSPAVQVGGTLILGRCSLDLTFDAAYNHVPGTITTLVTHGARDGQFLNFRRGAEFHRGPNRFRIGYDANSVTLTALPNWTTATPPPNVVLVFTDDQGYADIQLNGHPTWAAKYPMPRLQTLAQAGVRFTDAYVTGGVCHPSRVGLLTGRYQQRFGSDNNLPAATPFGMPPSQTTVPDRLQALGFRTYGIGKWHLGETVEFHPNVRGFDRWYGMWSGSRSYYNSTSESQVFQNQMTPVFGDENTGYLTDRIGDKAVAFIDEHTANSPGKPFFMYVSFTAVHGPNDMQFLDERFTRLQNQYGLTQADYTSTPTVYGGDKATTELERYRLAGMTLALDDNIGKIMDKVAQKGLTENTIFVYLNDNGGPGWATGSGGNWSYNFPLRGLKGGGMTEGSIRVPSVVSWPGTIPPGQVLTTPVSALDFMATFVNAGGAPAEARHGLDGLDLLPLLRDATPLPADRMLAWRASGVTGGGSAARIGDWKMLMTDPGGAPRLYNLRTDIGEATDRAAAQPAILNELRERFSAWEARILPPFYGGSDTALDPGLARWAIAGGLHLKTKSASPLWQSASLRTPFSTAADFDATFMLRPSETGPYPANAGLWHGLGDSTNHDHLIRFGVDYANGTLAIREGKTGARAAVPLAAELSTTFAHATLRYRAATGTVTLSIGDTSVSRVLGASYGNLNRHAMGASNIEGEVTTLRPIATGATGTETSTLIDLSAERLLIAADFGSEPHFEPRLERSPGLLSFSGDPETLTESLGGGIYRSTAPSSGLPSEFFRYRLDQP